MKIARRIARAKNAASEEAEIAEDIVSEEKQGRIHGYPSRVRVGRGSDREGHWGIWAGAVSSKRSKTPKK